MIKISGVTTNKNRSNGKYDQQAFHALLDDTSQFTISFTLLYGVSFVVHFLAFAEAYIHFRIAAFAEEYLERHNGVSLFFDLAFQLFQLLFGKKQFSFLRGQVIVDGTQFVFADVKAFYIQLAFVKKTISIIETGFACPQ
jgi:hypothetical protein